MFTQNTFDQEMIKDINQKKILQLLHLKREMTKQDMAQTLGLSIPTISNNSTILMKAGLIGEGGIADSTGGRKPVIMKFLPNSRFAFGVDISTTEIHVILTNLDSQILCEKKMVISKFEIIEEIIKKVSHTIQMMIKEKQIKEEKILGIGFSLPGTVNEENGNLEMAPNLGIYHLSFKKQFQSLFPFPIYIENEANTAALGELHLGVAKQMDNLVYLSIKEGIGCGIVTQGHLYKGKNKRAGEFGHMSIIPNGKKCNCGRKGCWELYASASALLSLYQEERKDYDKILLNKFFNQLYKKEHKAQVAVEHYIKFLAIGIQNIILALDPHYIIVGGDLGPYGDSILPLLTEEVFVKNSFYEKEDNTLIISALKKNASVLGASLLPLYKLFFYNSSIL